MNYTFEDVLILPQWSEIESRSQVDTTTEFLDEFYKIPIMSANMDTITESRMATKLYELGAVGVLHRFQTIEQNVEMFKKSPMGTFCSFGIGEHERKRFEALWNAGCSNFILDVAHGATKVTADQYIAIRERFNDARIVVGNFATRQSIGDFMYYCTKRDVKYPAAWKVGIGGGAMCTTRVVTGVGLPQLSALQECSMLGVPLIADGGIKNSGDYAKALAIPNVKMVMLGSLLSGTDETPGELCANNGQSLLSLALEFPELEFQKFKKYRGSASKESYEVQGKIADHRTAEGESTLVEYKGPVENVIQQLQAGLKSSMSYVGASNLTEFQERAKMVVISNNSNNEGKAHGKT